MSAAAIGVAVVVGRWLLFGGVLMLFGAALFMRHGMSAADGAATRGTAARGAARWSRRMLLGTALIALLASLLELMAQTAALSGDALDAVRWSVLSAVVAATHFGLIGALRAAALALLALSLAWPGAGLRRRRGPMWAAAVLTASFAWTGHGAMDQRWAGVAHLGADVLHLLAAGLWVGALVVLSALAVRARRSGTSQDAGALYAGLTWFSGVGPATVAVLLATGLVNTWFLVGPGHWRGLVSSAWGLTLCVKLVLFTLMLALAAANRRRWSPRLGALLSADAAADDPTVPVRAVSRAAAGVVTVAVYRESPVARVLGGLGRSVLAETLLALLVLAAVALLGTLVPPVSG